MRALEPGRAHPAGAPRGPARGVLSALAALSRGDESAAQRLFPVVYDQLRAITARYLRGERASPTLQVTAVVHEAYLRLAGRRDLDADDRGRFLVVAACAVRRVLVDRARRQLAQKRGEGARRVALGAGVPASGRGPLEVLALDEALEGLSSLHARLGRVVELRFFGGLSIDEVSHVLGVSRRTVEADWTAAKEWLRERLRGGAA